MSTVWSCIVGITGNVLTTCTVKSLQKSMAPTYLPISDNMQLQGLVSQVNDNSYMYGQAQNNILIDQESNIIR